MKKNCGHFSVIVSSDVESTSSCTGSPWSRERSWLTQRHPISKHKRFLGHWLCCTTYYPLRNYSCIYSPNYILSLVGLDILVLKSVEYWKYILLKTANIYWALSWCQAQGTWLSPSQSQCSSSWHFRPTEDLLNLSVASHKGCVDFH